MSMCGYSTRILYAPIAACCALAAVIGCQSTARPQLLDPGTAEMQRERAKEFDPWVRNDMHEGPLSDIRPRDFDQPSSEVKQTQNSPWARNSVGR
jgi:hypothetical protein